MLTVFIGATPKLQRNVYDQRWVPDGDANDAPSEFPSQISKVLVIHVVVLQRTAKKCKKF